jgi:hypothetical protein
MELCICSDAYGAPSGIYRSPRCHPNDVEIEFALLESRIAGCHINSSAVATQAMDLQVVKAPL